MGFLITQFFCRIADYNLPVISSRPYTRVTYVTVSSSGYLELSLLRQSACRRQPVQAVGQFDSLGCSVGPGHASDVDQCE